MRATDLQRLQDLRTAASTAWGEALEDITGNGSEHGVYLMREAMWNLDRIICRELGVKAPRKPRTR